MSPRLGLLNLALRDVARNALRSKASLLSLCAAFVAAAVFQGFIADATETVGANYRDLAMLGEVLIEAPKQGWAMEHQGLAQLGPEQQRVIDGFLARDPARQRVVARFLYVQGVITVGEDSAVFVGAAHDVAEGRALRGERWAWNTPGGVPLHATDAANAVLLGRRLALAMGCTVPPGVDPYLPEGGFKAEPRPMNCVDTSASLQGTTPDGRVTTVDATITGVVEAGLRQLEPRVVEMPLALGQDVLGAPLVTTYSVALRDPKDAPAFMAELRAAAEDAGVSISVARWQDHPFFGDMYRRVGGLLRLVGALFFVVLSLLSGMTVLNTVTRAVLERTREIGTLRALGFTDGAVLRLFALEGLLLALLASALGLVFTALIVNGVNAAHLHYPAGFSTFPVPMRLRAVPEFYAFTAALLGFCSALASAWPVRHTLSMSLAEALNHR